MRKITGEQIKALLEAHHVTQTKAAGLCHVNPRTFRRWTAGDIPMPTTAWELLHIKLASGQGMDFGFGVLAFAGARYTLLEVAHECKDVDDSGFSARAIDFAGNEYVLHWRSGAQVKSVALLQSFADKLERVGGNYGLLEWGGEVARDAILLIV